MTAPTRTLDSMAALRQAHLDLMAQVDQASAKSESAAPGNPHADPERTALRGLLPRIQALLEQGLALGVRLEDPRERTDAQVLLDHWRSASGRAGVSLHSARLAAFDPTQLPDLPPDSCPYVGLEPFREAQKADFHGRERDIAALVQRVHQQPLVVVLGASGSGKSSLVLAGALPALRAELGTHGERAWTVLPDLVPAAVNATGLAAAFAAEVVTRLQDNPAGGGVVDWSRPLPDVGVGLDALLRSLDGLDAPAVLTIDQFEEVFTLATPDEREQLVQILVALLSSPRGHRVLLTVREEFRAQVAGLQALAGWLGDEAWFQINPMRYEALKAAVEAPAQRVGLQFQPGVVDGLVRRVLGQPAALPLLQYAMTRLWQRKDRNRITQEVAAQLGDPLKALMNEADAFHDALAPDTQTAVQRVLLALVRIDDKLDVYRQPRFRRELQFDARCNDAIERLQQQGYVRVSPAPDPANDRVAICHESLVRNWPRLVAWIDDERLRQQQRLAFAQAAARWEAAGRPADGLLTDWQVNGVRTHAQGLGGVERDFFDASVAALAQAREARFREAEERTAQAQALAKEEKQRAEVAQRQAVEAKRLADRSDQLRRRAMMLLLTLFIFSAVLGSVGYRMLHQQQLLAQEQQEAVKKQLRDALDQQQLALRGCDENAQKDRRFAAELSRDFYLPGVAASGPESGAASPDTQPAAPAPAPTRSAQPPQQPQPLSTRPARITVFLHIGDAAQRPRAELLAAELRRGGLDVPGVELLRASRMPQRSQVRYFHDGDREAAQRIAKALKATLVESADTEPVRIAGYTDKVPPGQVELWFAADALRQVVSDTPPPPVPGTAQTPPPAPGTTHPQRAPSQASATDQPPTAGSPSKAPTTPPPARPSEPVTAPLKASEVQAVRPPLPIPNPHNADERVELLVHRLSHSGEQARSLSAINLKKGAALQTARRITAELNVLTPLGLAILYDTADGIGVFAAERLRRDLPAAKRADRGSEQALLREILQRRADRKPDSEAMRAEEEMRIRELRALLDAGQWDLQGERLKGH